MSQKHIVICDRCGKEEKLVRGMYSMSFSAPDHWEEVGDMDLCPSCYAKIKKEILKKG